MKSIKSLYTTIRLVLFISLLVFPNSGRKNEECPPYQVEYQRSSGTLKILVQNDSPAVDIPGEMVIELDGPDEKGRWYINITENAEIVFEQGGPGTLKSKDQADLDQAVTIPKGWRVFHLPRVKSGHSTEVLLEAMDFSLKATTALMVAPSYTSESMGRPSLRHWISR